MHRKAKGENPPPSIRTNQASPDDIFIGSKQKGGDNKEQSLGQTSKEGCEQLDSASRGVND